MALPQYIVSEFSHITRYPLATYLDNFVTFIENKRDDIVNYYRGTVTKPNITSFKLLNDLLVQAEKVNDLIEIHKNRFTNTSYWELIELLSNIQTTLWTIDNSSIWLRSSITKNNFTPSIEIEKTLKQHQTLENLSQSIGSNNKEQDWISIALRNDLAEEDYTPDGGTLIKLQYSNKYSFFLESVVDNIIGEKVYGIDIYRKLTFVDDDLRTLSPKETIVQTVDILSSLKQGDTPEFPQDGIQGSLVVGSNRMSIAYSVLFRQLYDTFKKDDTLKSFKIAKIENSQDWLKFIFEVETRLGDVVVQETII